MMNKAELDVVLEKHKKWLSDEPNGERTNLSKANLIGAILSGAILKGAYLSHTNLSKANLIGADLSGAYLKGAILSGAILKDAILKGADLTGTNIDYSVWPLWCGSLGIKTEDTRILSQLAYHFCSFDCNDPEYLVARNSILEFANKFHRVGNDCAKLTIGQAITNGMSIETNKAK